ncbi:MAG: hypothetical protein PHH75_01445 [Candidatus Omnitrophica bacterium]|nr:hypothetical protein [Candidatus Omnitrophota bacterium]MDD5573823.1 hypothetical protein [Candidatus Omnitrophota bacterium]
MKKGLAIIIAAGLLLSCAPAAKSDTIISLGFTGEKHHPYSNKHIRDNRHNHNDGRYPHGYYYWPPKPYSRVYTQTVIKTIKVQPKKTMILSDQEKLGISDIIFLSKAAVSDDAIIDKIARTRSVFNLTAEEVSMLVKEGVSNRVVNFMLKTKR